MTDTQKDYLSVKALTRYLKRKFDMDPYLQKVYVVGEVSNFRLRTGHQYFSLKEDNVKINVTMFKQAFSKLPFKLEEGMKVLAVGRVSIYEPSGSYQLTLESLQPDGVGSLYLALEQLKSKLKQAGLLDLPKKQPRRFPRRIAVITSPSGAVIRDIVTTLKRRYPIAQVVVFPTRVQGKEASGEIVAAFERLKAKQAAFDTVILARGGGAIEDLWPFNEEIVAQAILACPLPVITAIGHETDTTIADLVGDLRAPTPTAAAEMAAEELSQVYLKLEESRTRLAQAMLSRIQHKQTQLRRYQEVYIFREPERLYQAYMQQVDLIKERLLRAQSSYLQGQAQGLALLSTRLKAQGPSGRLHLEGERLARLRHQLQRAMAQTSQHYQGELARYSQLLEAYSPLKILARGYAIIEDKKEAVKSVQQLQVGQVIDLTLQDGQATAQVQTISAQKGKNHGNKKEKT